MNILITGSDGLIGGIISRELEKEHNLVLLDKERGVDILEDDLKEYFREVDIVIHLAANPNPFIEWTEAEKNIEIARRVIQSCEGNNVGRIINASSINVYPYIDIFESGKRLDDSVDLTSNLVYGDGSYGRGKIEVEKVFEDYCKKNNVALLNLRIGCVTPYDTPNKDGNTDELNRQIHLKQSDLINIIKEGLNCKGIESYVCVSKKNGFVDSSVRLPRD